MGGIMAFWRQQSENLCRENNEKIMKNVFSCFFFPLYSNTNNRLCCFSKTLLSWRPCILYDKLISIFVYEDTYASVYITSFVGDSLFHPGKNCSAFQTLKHIRGAFTAHFYREAVQCAAILRCSFEQNSQVKLRWEFSADRL